MRIALFYSETEAFNYFTDQLVKEFTERGHETFILDLTAVDIQKRETYEPFFRFLSQKVDAAVCFDGLGAREDMFIQAWDSHDAVVVDIMLDPPLRFHSTLEKHPRNYHLFCCDRNHVAYVKKIFRRDGTPGGVYAPRGCSAGNGWEDFGFRRRDSGDICDSVERQSL